MPIQNFDIPENEYTIDILIDLMNQLEKMDLNNPFLKHFAKSIFVNGCTDCTIKNLNNWCMKHFQFEEDQDFENLTRPSKMLNIRKGDCDDFALFQLTVLHILNIPAKYIFLSKDGNEFTHVAVYSDKKIIDAQRGVYDLQYYFRTTPYKYYEIIN